MSEELVTIAHYRDLPEALLAQGMLEAAGIACELADDNMVRMDWFLSNLIGGIRLQVDRDEMDEAIEVLASPVPPELPGDNEAEQYRQPTCPQCGSFDISPNTRSQWISAAILYYVHLPIPLPKAKSWHCWDCGAHWIREGKPEGTDAP